ncbi:LOW QUALITY PROTEIN: hypothetical protein V2J09_018074, partial [Rumex salicifolius]
LKQAPRAWFSRIRTYFIGEGFLGCDSEQILFTKKSKEGKIISPIWIMQFKTSMMKEINMSDLGLMNYFLGIEMIQKKKGTFICQRRYAEEVLKRFGIWESHPVNNPIEKMIDSDFEGILVDETRYNQIIGSLMYLTSTRPDLMFATSLISRYMARPTELHFQVAKRILRYLKGTLSKNPVMHGRSKHIDVHFHFLRNLSTEGVISLSYCASHDQVADIMTKPLKPDVFLKLRSLLGICDMLKC